MQQLLEYRSPFDRLTGDGGKGGRTSQARRRRNLLIVAVMGVFLLIMVAVTRGVAGAGDEDGSVGSSGSLSSSSVHQQGKKPRRQSSDDSAMKRGAAVDAGKSAGGKGTLPPPPVVEMLDPWGYNKERNIPRAKAILASIAADVNGGRFASTANRFTVVDYGADQGYFSISSAKIFKGATVMGIEMGGVGGEIWKKADSQDVLSIQEGKIREHGVGGNMQICQTKVVPESFFKLQGKGLVSDYQYVLSVFHWFDLPTRADFERTISTLFLNARTTFIELPIIGDNSALIRKQVGWKNFVKWYDGRTDMTQIIAESAESQGLSVKVTLVAAVPWVKWQRETYRVDVLGVKGGDAPLPKFGCSARRSIYGCAARQLYSACPTDENAL